MKINRVWAMPNKWTFKIEPIADLIKRYVRNGKGWIDPFAGFNSPAEFTNDLNPESPAKYHLEATEFIKQLKGKYEGAIFDPPYSMRQAKESYEQYGFKQWQSICGNGAIYVPIRKRISELLKIGGLSISFGWNSNGLGKKRKFEIIEILLVAHGRGHNDTICTVEKKIQGKLF
jgi:hypothetical protein